MRWITYALCVCVVAVHLNRAMPMPEQDVARTKVEETAQDSALSEEASEVKEVRVPYVPSESDNDLQTAASGGDSEEAESSQEELSDDIDIDNDENSRSKRLGMFGNLLGGISGGASIGGGASGGSGNFLFDIIRTTADGVARAAGSVYRLVAGTNDLGLNGYNNNLTVPSGVAFWSQTATSGNGTAAPSNSTTTTTTARPTTIRTTTTTTTSTSTTASTLVAGSGATEQQDENANAPLAPTAPDHLHPLPVDDGYQAGIPGPITRLFVIANRGIANLMQDLILRLAQTSERIVNFKARLITAII